MNALLLPDLDLLHTPQLKRVVSALTDGESRPRIVGGAVRDGLLGLPVTDIDLATPILPETVINRLQEADIKSVPTGLGHGTVTAILDGKSYEITTLRRDVSTDGRRATVAYSLDWDEDAARRDFTINALYADPVTREIFDYFGGLEDLKNHRLRFIGDASERIAEDHLRILRYFRFLARFGGNEVDENALKACRAGANTLMALSRERIASELMKIITAANPVHVVTLMIENQIFAPFLPELDDNADAALSRLVEREREFAIAASAPARLITLLPANAAIADKVAMRLKLSNKTRKDLAVLLGQAEVTPVNIYALAYASGMDTARDMALLFASDSAIAECLQRLAGWHVPRFEIKGGDLIAQGLKAGPMVAKTMRIIERKWVDGGFVSGEALAVLVEAEVAAALSGSVQ
jgi:poly(A) polymerase